MEPEGDGQVNCNSCTQNDPQRTSSGTGGLGNKRMTADHLNYSTVKLGQNTKMTARDLRRLANTPNPVRRHVKNSQRK